MSPSLLDRPAVLYVVAVLAMAFIGLVEHVSGAEISFSISYLLPVGLVALKGKKSAALVFAVASGVIWAALDIPARDHSHWAIGYWNALVRFGVFTIVAVTVSGLKEHVAQESALASNDPLTGVANSGAFYAVLEKEAQRMGRTRRPFVVAYRDLDNSKLVNDEEGHLAGDDALRSCASTLTKNVRAIDSAARLGGDEFSILLPETELEEARSLLGRLRIDLAHETQTDPRPTPVTFSIGAVAALSPPRDVEDLVRAADSLMYRVKESGKDGLAIEGFEPPEAGS
jgi:diguanylate cyclase (GGDEF)-like protein